MRGLAAAVALAALAAAPAGAGATASNGSFVSSDAQLNGIWTAAVKTATDMVVAGPLVKDALGRPCGIDLPKVIIDGVVRDRCPYVGDEAVSGMTLFVSTPADIPVLRSMIVWFADAQHADGSIPASPLDNGNVVLIDYNAYWVEDLFNFVLYRGDLGLAREVWPHLLRLLNGWYVKNTGTDGLLVNPLGPNDYASPHRTGTVVAYYNAGYVRALDEAAELATWLGHPALAKTWLAREQAIARVFSSAFWDAKAGAFRDATVGTPVHPEDGNVFAVLAGLATKKQAVSALDYLSAKDTLPYGNAMAENNVWDSPLWGAPASERVYPFITYFDVLARYRAGLGGSGLELLEREWGYMLDYGPKTTDWETIGPYGGAPVNVDPSWDSGWSSGAAPLITNYVLGVRPVSPGFGSYIDAPTGYLNWAKGNVPTPHGTIHIEYQLDNDAFVETVQAPVPGTLVIPYGGAVTVDGKNTGRVTTSRTTVRVEPGSHTVVIHF